jgi:hypothetical protein
MRRRLTWIWAVFLLMNAYAAEKFVALPEPSATTATAKETPAEPAVFYRTTQIDGLSIFYREAGPENGPAHS